MFHRHLIIFTHHCHHFYYLLWAQGHVEARPFTWIYPIISAPSMSLRASLLEEDGRVRRMALVSPFILSRTTHLWVPERIALALAPDHRPIGPLQLQILRTHLQNLCSAVGGHAVSRPASRRHFNGHIEPMLQVDAVVEGVLPPQPQKFHRREGRLGPPTIAGLSAGVAVAREAREVLGGAVGAAVRPREEETTPTVVCIDDLFLAGSNLEEC